MTSTFEGDQDVPGRRRASTTRPLPVLAALLVAVALVSGCSTAEQNAVGAPGSGASLPRLFDSQALLDAVGARQRADRSALVTMNGTLDPPGTGMPADGDPDPPGRRAVTANGALRIDDAVASRFDQRVGAAGGPTRGTGVIRTDGRTYLRLPGAPDGRWGEVGRIAVAPADRVDAALATNIASTMDPLAGVTRYADAVLVADAVQEELDARPVVRYTLVVDLVRAAAAENDPGLRAQLDTQMAGGLTRISSDLWVDAQQRPVRSRIRQEIPGAGTLDLVSDYRSWGAQVTIEPPPTG